MTAPKTRGPALGIPLEVLASVDELAQKHGEGGQPLPRGDVLHGLLLLAALFPNEATTCIRAASAAAALRVSEARRRAASAQAEAMAPEQRRERASKAASARWDKKRDAQK